MSGEHDIPVDGRPAVFDLSLACEAMELTPAEVLVLIPQARVEITARLGSLREALGTLDQATLIRDSHTIKSVTAALAAEPVSRAAEELEMRARAGADSGCHPLAVALEQEAERLLRALERL